MSFIILGLIGLYSLFVIIGKWKRMKKGEFCQCSCNKNCKNCSM